MPYEYARRAGSLRVPGTYVPLSGSALFAALLRASRELGRDLSRVSVDVLCRADIEDAFTELGARGRRARPRGRGQRGDTGRVPRAAVPAGGDRRPAFTCLQFVAQRLAAAEVPVRMLRPTTSAIRSALRTATLLAASRRLEEAQLAVALVEVPTLRDTSRRSSPRHAREELRLTVHRFLVQEAHRMHATVSPVSDHCFLVTATRGSLAAATDGFRVPPVQRAGPHGTRHRGRSWHRDGPDCAGCRGPRAGGAVPVEHGRWDQGLRPGPGGHGAGPLARHPAASATDPVRPRGLETLSRLADKLAGSDSALVVDAETAGRVLGVTARTARRLLHGLVEEGLAWPLPPSRAPQPGRPWRQFYRLVTEKLERRAPR